MGPAARIFTDASASDSATTRVTRNSASLAGRHSSERPGSAWFTMASSAARFSASVSTSRRRPQMAAVRQFMERW